MQILDRIIQLIQEMKKGASIRVRKELSSNNIIQVKNKVVTLIA